MDEPQNCEALSDRDLMTATKLLAREQREHLAKFLRHLAEVDLRKLYAPEGYPSMFAYCVKELRYSGDEAYRRIHAARAARKHPTIYRMLKRGRITLSVVSKLAPHLSPENYRTLLAKAAGRSKRETERLIAAISPTEERPDRIRHIGPAIVPAQQPIADRNSDGKLPFMSQYQEGCSEPKPVPPSQKPATGNGLTSLESAPQRVEFIFSANEALLAKIQRARVVLRNKRHCAKLEDLFDAALETLLDKHDPERLLARKAKRAANTKKGAARSTALSRKARTDTAPEKARTVIVTKKRPSAAITKPRTDTARPRSRRIPAAVKDEVYRRDGGRCTYVSPKGRCCQSQENLQYDHIEPFALGGRSDDPRNIRLLCGTHNRLVAREIYGKAGIETSVAARRSRLRRTPGRGSSQPGVSPPNNT